MDTLPTSDRRELRRLETIVEHALRLHLEAAKALLTIRDQRLYRQDYATFADYCEDRWGISRIHAHRLCDYAQVVENVLPIGNVPIRESHARPLVALTPAQQRIAWRQVLALPSPTAADVQRVAVAVRCKPVQGKNGHDSHQPTDERSPLNWFGGKAMMAKQIVKLLPKHQTYIEPFAGSLAVLYAKTPSIIEVVNDKSDGIVNFFQVVRDHVKELQRRLKLTPYSRTEHAKCKADPTGDSIERARKFFVRVRQSFGCIQDGQFSRTLGGTSDKGTEFVALVDRLHLAAARLRHVQIENCCGLELLRECDREGVTVYADPTYLHSTRDRNGLAYEHEMSEKEHEELLRTITGYRKARCVLSGYRSDLYDRSLKRWTRYEFLRRVHASCRTESKPKRVECVWVKT